MAISPTYPGVYVAEKKGDQRTITGVSTSTALFIGMTKSGPPQRPTLCFNYSDYVRQFTDGTTNDDFSRQVRLFFINGGTQCYVTRIVDSTALTATTTLSSEAGTSTLVLTAKSVGAIGNEVRVAVTYTSNLSESGFDLEIFRWQTDSAGRKTKVDQELWRNLSMDPGSSMYAVDFLNSNSNVVAAALPAGAATPTAGTGWSISAPIVEAPGAAGISNLQAALQGNGFQISVGNRPFVAVGPIGTFTTTAGLQAALTAALGTVPVPVGVSLSANVITLTGTTSNASVVQISATGADVLIAPATDPTKDAAVKAALGTAQGGLELSAFASYRPAPTALVAAANPSTLSTFATAPQGPVTVAVDATTFTMNVGAVGGLMFEGPGGVADKLQQLAAGINAQAASTPGFNWRASVWGARIALVATDGSDDFKATTASVASSAGLILDSATAGDFTLGPRYDKFSGGNDGGTPQSTDYEAVYPVVDREVDIFNLMVLPPRGVTPGGTPQEIDGGIWGPASVFCQQRRAFLLVDAPLAWKDAQGAAADVGARRIGLSTEYAGVFFPRLVVSEGPQQLPIGPSGAIAGLMARIDGERGVWKAPAGTEADIRGIVGVERRFSDGENGVMNPKAINTIRVFPTGVVSWGARTMAGDDANQTEYKYIPIRRLALFMEESLYRGLKWVVFEPNDEPLWSQIRLNVGAFMHDLFRQGAFQGTTPKDAYFVRCDSETTTQSDRDLGIVNIWVGFAPLKPAEFVVLYLQQMAGQLQA